MLALNSLYWQRVRGKYLLIYSDSFFFILFFFSNLLVHQLINSIQFLEDAQSLTINKNIYNQDSSQPISTKPKRRRGNLPKTTTALLKGWLIQHKKHPYPTEDEKLSLARETKLSMQQISNWFINARRRHLPNLLKISSHDLDIFSYEGADNGGGRIFISWNLLID